MEAQKIGVIAGGGQFPCLIVEEAQQRGREVTVVGIKGLASGQLQRLTPDRTYWVEVGEFDKLINILKKNGVSQVMMAGKISHSLVYQRVKIDHRLQTLLSELKDRKTDSLLRGIADALTREGIQVVDSTTFLSHYFVLPGILTERAPTPEEMEDISFGRQIACEIARLDIGQTVVVKDKAVIAVEGMEGTDELIRRGGKIGGKGVVVVKVSKPQQDMRFDVPVVGLNTIETMAEAGASALAVDAGKTLFFDKEKLLSKANQENITIIALS
ncbi:MAG: LpxI family protein [Acidobacteriota bacterium]